MQEEKVNVDPCKWKKNMFILHYSYHYLTALKEAVSLGPIFHAFVRFFLVSKYPFTCKFHGWMISVLHHFLEHMPSGHQNSQKSSLHPLKMHTPENK